MNYNVTDLIRKEIEMNLKKLLNSMEVGGCQVIVDHYRSLLTDCTTYNYSL